MKQKTRRVAQGKKHQKPPTTHDPRTPRTVSNISCWCSSWQQRLQLTSPLGTSALAKATLLTAFPTPSLATAAQLPARLLPRLAVHPSLGWVRAVKHALCHSAPLKRAREHPTSRDETTTSLVTAKLQVTFTARHTSFFPRNLSTVHRGPFENYLTRCCWVKQWHTSMINQ